MSTIKYRPEIDGLRAVAVVPVILFHVNESWMQGGFVGVDVFFVISGYLITLILLTEYEQGIFSFKQFWLRRIRRILPVMLVMIIATCLTGSFLLYSQDINTLGNQAASALLSFSNINFWLNSGSYWGAQAENSLVLHTWSLSVEEQFYFIFPLLLFLLLKYYKKYLTASIVTLILLSVLAFLFGSHYYPTSTFYLLPTRAWELGIGSFIAVLAHGHHNQPNSSNYLSFIGILSVLLSCAMIDGSAGVSHWMMIPVLGSSLIIMFAHDNANFVYKILSKPSMVFIGKISYSLYIWHWPILSISKQLYPSHNSPSFYLSVLAIIGITSIASYYLIEKTTRRNPKIVPYILLILFFSLIYSVWLAFSSHSEETSMYSETRWNGQLYNVAPDTEVLGSENKRMEGVVVPRRKSDGMLYDKGGLVKRYGGNEPDIVLLGSSHALMYAGVLDEIAEELNKTISFYAADGTPTFFEIPPLRKKPTLFFTSDEKYIFDKKRLEYLEKWKPKVVVIAPRWSTIKSIEMTRDLIEYVGKLGSKVLLIEQPPELYFGDKNTPKYLSFLGLFPSLDAPRQYISGLSRKEYKKGKAIVRALSKQYSHCDYIQTERIFAKYDKVWVLDGTKILYIDDNHLSYEGSLKVKNQILSYLEKFLNDEKKNHRVQ